jgi:hypothetical protein
MVTMVRKFYGEHPSSLRPEFRVHVIKTLVLGLVALAFFAVVGIGAIQNPPDHYDGFKEFGRFLLTGMGSAIGIFGTLDWCWCQISYKYKKYKNLAWRKW